MMNKKSMKKKVYYPSFLNLFSFIVIEAILGLGNNILKSIGVEENIEDVGVFFR